jgi:hypothetical protein
VAVLQTRCCVCQMAPDPLYSTLLLIRAPRETPDLRALLAQIRIVQYVVNRVPFGMHKEALLIWMASD